MELGQRWGAALEDQLMSRREIRYQTVVTNGDGGYRQCERQRHIFKRVEPIDRADLAVLSVIEQHRVMTLRRGSDLFVKVVAVMQEPCPQLSEREACDEHPHLGG